MSFLISCQSEDKTVRYTISDIKFPEDHLREVRKKHLLKKSCFYIDSALTNGITYHVSKQPVDSRMTIMYDNNGNEIQNVTGTYSFSEGNVMTHAETAMGHFAVSFNYLYLFDHSNKILYRLSYDDFYRKSFYNNISDGDYQKVISGRRIFDSVIYQFDTLGRIVSYHDRLGPATVYQYDVNGKVTLASWSKDERPGGYENVNREKRYYYTNNKIDSIVITYIPGNDSVYTERHYFDKDELLYRCVEYVRLPIGLFYEQPLVSYSVKHFTKEEL
ncbi:MAG: hypothetical protein JNL72_14855 [Flavipsychrobacter sp.]|nr:hypothetical protein [Flavipsychrobacter sp.]